ncbi:uncharacterized protein LOC143050885 [Mytilus galloprovincialis]|uniref:uncharacterized protein LOC143050885 n=1 Tax=Mytilus galloprovincialis TaxID=29158 RepID=UPI003F7C60BA
MLLAFDVGDYDTFNSIKNRWIEECQRFAQNAKLIIVGVQSDITRKRNVNKSDVMYLSSLHQYCEISLKTKEGVEECITKITDVVLEARNPQRKRASVGHNIANFMKKGAQILQKIIPEKHAEQETVPDQKQQQASTDEQSKLHAIFDQHGKQILRSFIVDKVLPLGMRDWKVLGNALGYDPKTLRMPSQCDFKNPYWQMLKFWTEQSEDLHIVSMPLMYRSLINIKQKSIAKYLLTSILENNKEDDLKAMIENKFHHSTETEEILELKAKLKTFCFSQEADQTPPVIWKMGKSAGDLYKDILQGGTEARHCIRIMIVGPFGVGKTCLMRRLLKKDIKDVVSTNGINIMVLRCKVRLSDRTWIISDELMDHADQDRQRRLCQNLIRQRHKSFSDNISFDKKFEFKEKVKVQSHESLDIGISTTDTSSNTGYTKYVAEKKQKVNRQPIAEDTVQKSGESLLKDFDGLQFSEESMDEFAEVVMLDFAGQYEFYATHQTFLNKHAIYLLVLDISKDLKGSLTSEDLDDTLTDLAEIPLEHIGEYVNFWMDAIHCYSENENCNGLSEQDDDKSEQNLPSVIVVGTCSDKLKVCNLFLDYIV